MDNEVPDFIVAALEASIYCVPDRHGLTQDELLGVGMQARYRRGELEDAIRALRLDYDHESTPTRWRLPQSHNPVFADFHDEVDPEYRNALAFEFVLQELDDVGRHVGASRTGLARRVLVSRGVAKGYPAQDVEVAITMLQLVMHLSLGDDDIVRLTDSGRGYARPLRQIADRRATRLPRRERPLLRRAHPIVMDLIARRVPGRLASPDPLRAFEAELAGLGYTPFKLWWSQQLSEVDQLDDATTPTAVTVLCAALCEGALVLVADQAQKLGKTMTSKGVPPGDYKKWKFDDLIVGARQPPEPIFDQPTVDRCMDLNRIRQRIHAGRLVSDPHSMSFDAKPEEASRARETLKQAVRRILEWIERSRGATSATPATSLP